MDGMGYNFYGWHMGGGWFPIVFVARGLCDGSCRQGFFVEDIEEVVHFQTQVLSTAVTMTIYNMWDKHDVYGCFQYRGTPKWMVYNGKPIKMDDLGGFPIIFGNTHMSGNPPGNLRGQKTTKWWLNERLWGALGHLFNGGTGSIFSPQVLDLKTDVPKPLGFLQWLVGWLVGVQVDFQSCWTESIIYIYI